MHLRIRISFDYEANTCDLKKQRLVFFLQINSKTNNAYTDEHFSRKINTDEKTYKRFLRKFNAMPMTCRGNLEELYFQTKDEAYKATDFLSKKYDIRLATATEKYRNVEQHFVYKERNIGEIFY